MLFITEPLVSLKKKRTGIRPRKAMGCVLGKYSVNSSPTSGGLEKLKMESGYVGKGDIAGHRRSTGQRYSGRLPKPEQPTRKYIGGCADNGEERKLSDTGQNVVVVTANIKKKLTGSHPGLTGSRVDPPGRPGFTGPIPKRVFASTRTGLRPGSAGSRVDPPGRSGF